MVTYEPKVAEPKMKYYAYDPHLSPQLPCKTAQVLKQLKPGRLPGLGKK